MDKLWNLHCPDKLVDLLLLQEISWMAVVLFLDKSLSCYRAIERLIDHLQKTGLIKILELGDEEIADALWLALHMEVVEAKPKEKANSKASKGKDGLKVNNISEEGETNQSAENISFNAYTQEDTDRQESEGQSSTKGLPFQAPAAPALPNKLPIGRALRPLMRKVPSTTRKIIDAEATVTRIAEQNIWVPVTKPEPERWLQLELIIEESRSSFIWQETIEELQKLLQNHGAFRTVRTWTLSYSHNNLQLTRRRKGNQSGLYQHHYRELIPGDKRALILLVSDCVSGAWQHPEIYDWLQQWSSKIPTAIVQLFPERLWQSSELGLGYKLPFSAFAPGVPNSKLFVPPLWQEFKGKDFLNLPVVTLDQFSIKQWARIIDGRGSTKTPGFVLDLNFVRQQIKQAKTAKAKKVSAEGLVDRFLATASPTAQRLAGLMAAAPVSLSVVNLIQKTFLPYQSTPVTVAEVFLSGMIQRTNSSDKDEKPEYDFVPQVRKILNQATRLPETEKVLDVLATEIAKDLGLSIKSFTALLRRHQSLSKENQEKALPFARFAIEVLQNLGGEYADFAREVASEIADLSRQFSPSISEDKPKIPEPELKTCPFEVATIEIEETRAFEFTVAILERQPPSVSEEETEKNRQTAQWSIKRQRRQATGIIEALEEGIELELMEIPEGIFMMGSPKDETDSYDYEKTQHEVHVPSFYMGRYPITQAQWKAIASDISLKVERDLEPDPSSFKDPYQDLDRWTRPVENVSWYDAKEFCARLSKKTKRDYRLPTEAEWEYACRAGTTTPFHFGETITTDLANYQGTDEKIGETLYKGSYGEGPKGEYREQTTPVGYFKVANAFGLYDMHGNVWEWCEDDWHNSYEGTPPTDGSAWISNDKEDTTKIIRGGSWFDHPNNCRSASRNDDLPRLDLINVGFRVVCSAPRNPSPSAL